MKKIAFVTLYDTICQGPRLLSAIAKSKGFESHLIIFEKDTHNKPIFYGTDREVYTYFHQGILRGSILKVHEPSESEKDILVALIGDLKPDLLCLSTRSFGLQISRELILQIRNSMNEFPIIAGGWGPTMEPDKFLEFCDAVCIGEGEKPFTDLLDRLDQGVDFRDVKNLAFSDGNETVYNDVYAPLRPEEMEDLPFPDFETENKFLISDNAVQKGASFYNEKIYDCFAGRGCPMSCSYCMSSKYKKLYEQFGHRCPKYRLRNVEIVINELLEAKKRGAIHIRIKDEVFPYNKKWLETFFRLYKQKINLPFFGYIRPEFHSEEIIRQLAKSGLVTTLVGIQSGSDYILKHIYNRNMKKETAKRFALLLDELGVEYSYHLISHNPFEKEDDLDETLRFCYELPQAPMHVFRLVVFPKSPIAKRIKDENPKGLPRSTYDWYSLLYCMATESSFFKKLAKIIHKTRVLDKWPYVLQILFIPPLLKEYYRRLRTAKHLKTSSSLSVPLKQKVTDLTIPDHVD